MAVVSDIELVIRAGVARLQQDMQAVRRTVDNGLGSVARTVSTVKTALGGLAAGFAVKELLSKVIDAQREFDKLNASLETATGSTANAAQAFAALQKFAATTPFSVAEATEAFIKLRNQGLNPSEAALRSYGNTASGANKSLDQFIEAVADASRSQFERLQEFAIAAKQNGSQVTFTFQGLSKTVGNNSKEIQAYLQSIGNVQFAGAMEKQANTLNGAINNLGDTWQGLLRTIAQNGIGEAVRSATTQLGGALSDLGVILDIVGGKAKAEGKAMSDAGAFHTIMTGIFKALGVGGVFLTNVLGGLADSVVALASSAALAAKGDFAGAKKILEDASKAGKERVNNIGVELKAVLGASAQKQAAAEAEAAATKKSSGDQLAGYEVVLTAQQKQDKALNDSLELRNRLNGTNAQTAGDLKKLKEAYDTGGITLAQYNKFVAQINKETALSSTAYKDSVKAIDLSAAAIQRRAAAQAFANQQAQENLDFLKRTGQLNEEDYIKKSADADIKALQDAKTALEATRDLEARKIDNRVKVMDLNGQIDEQERKIAARRTKTGQDEFELEQKLYREAVNNTADLIEAAQVEAKTQKDRTRDMQDEIDMLGLTGKQIAEVTAARLRDQAAALDRGAEIGTIEEVNDALRAQAEELRKQADLGLTKERVQEQQKFWGDIEQTAHDTFVSIADGGKGAFQRLKDSAKNIFFEWLYQMTLKKWIVNIGASTDGVAATAGLVSGGGSGSSLLNAASNIGSLYKSITGLASGNLGTGFLGSLVGGLNGAGAGAPLGSALGVQIGNTIANTLGPTLSGALSTGISGLATALPWVGGAVAVYSLAKAAFGMGPKQYADSSTLTGTLGAGGFSGSVNTAWTQKGGWLRSNKSGTDKAAVDAVLASGLASTYDAIKTATKGYADVLGLNAASIADRTQTLNIALGKDEAANQKAIADFFTGVSDTIATEVLPSISQFQASGENAGATLQRLATDFAGVNALMEKVGIDLGRAFKDTGVAAIAARERIVSLAGGLDALGTQLDFYYSNFLAAAERIQPLQKQITDQLATLGVPWIKSAADYRLAVEHLVNSGEAATESGAALYTGLLKLAPAFKSMTDAVKELNQAAVDRAFAALSRAVNAQKDVVTEAYNAAMAVLDSRITGLNDTISRTTELSQELKRAFQGIDTPQAAGYARQAAQAQITAFLAIARAGGALPSASDIQSAVSALSNDASGQYSTLADYQRDVARTNNELEQLGVLTDGQLSAAQQQLAVLQDQKTIAQTAYEAEIARLDSLGVKAQAQLDAINGVDTSVKTVAEALAEVNVALLALNGPYGTPAAPIIGGASVLSGILSKVYTQAVPIAEDTSSVSYGTMSSSNADMGMVLDRLASMEENMATTARATQQLAGQFNQISGGGNALLVEQA
jgi:hypothetical protein